MKTVYISYQSIKDLHPCADQLRAARKLFGKRKRMAVTVQRAVDLSSQFNFGWLARNTLTAPALQAYSAAMVPAQQAYDAATAQAWQAYNAARAQARQAYDAARAQAWQAQQAYDAATAQAGQAYVAAMARAWAQHYIKQQAMKG